MPAINVTPPQLAKNDWRLAVSQPRSSRKNLMIGLAVCALLLLVLFVSFRFFGLGKLSAHGEGRKGPAITSIVVEKNDAIDPLDEGFKLFSIGHLSAHVMPNAINHGVDRWRIASDNQAYYYRTLTSAEKSFALSHDWKLTCVCAIEKGSASINIDFGKGARRFDIALLQEGDKYYVALTKLISPELEWEQKIEFPGAGDIDHLHTYELRYDHSNKAASLWIDGRLLASGYHGHTQFLEDRGLIFGTYSYLLAKTGIGVFRSARFEVH